MKKYIKLFAISVICIVLALSCLACEKNDNPDTDPDNSEETPETIVETFKTEKEIRDSLINYSFKYQLSYNDGNKIIDTTYIDKKTEDSWFYVAGNAAFLANITEQSLYMLDLEDKTAILTDLDEDMDQFSTWGTIFFDWYKYADDFIKTGTSTIVGRPCNVYEYSLGTIKYIYHIDTINDICLKYEITESSTSQSTVFVFTEFILGGITTQEVLSVLEGYTIDNYKGIF